MTRRRSCAAPGNGPHGVAGGGRRALSDSGQAGRRAADLREWGIVRMPRAAWVGAAAARRLSPVTSGGNAESCPPPALIETHRDRSGGPKGPRGHRLRQTLYLLSKDGGGSAAPLVAALTDRVMRAGAPAGWTRRCWCCSTSRRTSAGSPTCRSCTPTSTAAGSSC